METSAKTKLLGIFGCPLEHTLSPKMHSYFAKISGVDVTYLAFETQADDFLPAVDQVRKMGAQGFNITSPYKIEVLKAVDVLDPEAQLIGSVNTIVNREGKWHGYNTDGVGFLDSFETLFGSVAGKKVLMLGAGGSARSIAYKLAQRAVASITMTARHKEKAAAIGELIQRTTPCPFFDEMNPGEKYDIIINLTPLGMHPYENENPFAEHMDMLAEDTLCYDLIYNPKKTLFLTGAEKRGSKIMNGLPMLVMQGIYAFELFTGCKLPEDCFFHTMELFSEYRI